MEPNEIIHTLFSKYMDKAQEALDETFDPFFKAFLAGLIGGEDESEQGLATTAAISALSAGLCGQLLMFLEENDVPEENWHAAAAAFKGGASTGGPSLEYHFTVGTTPGGV